MKLVTLTKQTTWYGQYSGYYEQIPKYLSPITLQSVVAPRPSWAFRACGKAASLLLGLPSRNQSNTYAELEFLLYLQARKQGIGFVTAVENHLPLISRLKKRRPDIVGTIHFPRTRWNEDTCRQLTGLSSALVLYKRDIEFFEDRVGPNRVRFVPHGVDVDFYRPPEAALADVVPRVLVVGQFDRDFEQICRCFAVLRKRHDDLKLDLVVANHALRLPAIRQLAETPGCVLHSGISDAELKDLYQRASCVLLPMVASGANNAIVEALACGTPIVTNDVGGIRDYGGASVFPIASCEDELIDLANIYLADPKCRQEIGRKCRYFAEDRLSWHVVAKMHKDALLALCH